MLVGLLGSEVVRCGGGYFGMMVGRGVGGRVGAYMVVSKVCELCGCTGM